MYTQAHLIRMSLAGRAGLLRRTVLLLGALLLAAGARAESGAFAVTEVQSSNIGEVEVLDARFAIRLSVGAREALDNGVPLTLELQVQLVRENDWLWDVVEAEHVLVRQLQFHALTRSYQLRDLASNTLVNYSQVEDALAAAGTIERLLLVSQPLREDSDYTVRLRGSIDIEALPTPVRLLAYVSSDWDMQSEWFAWPLNR